MEREITVKLDKEHDQQGNLWITIYKKYIHDKDRNKEDVMTFRLMLHEFKELQLQVDNLIMKKK